MHPVEETDYNGIPIRSRGNVHSMVFDMIHRLPLAKNAEIIDLGAGEGAFCRRLSDAGYTNLEACEIAPGRFQLPGIDCHSLDLNTHHFDQILTKKYSLAIAIEIIEHLENPANFFRSISGVLEPGGYLIVTTPHVSSWYSRILFLRTGQLHWFNESSCMIDGHISPLFGWQMKHFCESAGMKILHHANTEDYFLRQRHLSGTFRTRLLYWLLKPIMEGNIRGEICLRLVQKSVS